MIRILIVDDNLEVRKALANLINSIESLKVVGECSDGIDVIPFLASNTVDVMFTDIHMTYLNGYETTMKVKRVFPEVKIIGCSSYADIAIVSKIKDCGADGFISKGDLSKETIVTEIKKVLKHNS